MLVLSARADRKGNVKSFDVVRAEEGRVQDVAAGLPTGEYKALDGSRVLDFTTGYRTVQDVTVGDSTVTIEA